MWQPLGKPASGRALRHDDVSQHVQQTGQHLQPAASALVRCCCNPEHNLQLCADCRSFIRIICSLLPSLQDSWCGEYACSPDRSYTQKIQARDAENTWSVQSDQQEIMMSTNLHQLWNKQDRLLSHQQTQTTSVPHTHTPPPNRHIEGSPKPQNPIIMKSLSS